MVKIFNKAKEKTIRKRFGLSAALFLTICITAVYFLNENKLLFVVVFAATSFTPLLTTVLSSRLVKYTITDNNRLTTTWGTSINISNIVTIITNTTPQLTLVSIRPFNDEKHQLHYYEVENKKEFINALLQVNSKIIVETENQYPTN